MRRLSAFALVTTLSAAGLVVTGCYSGPTREEAIADKTYLDDRALESFDKQLRDLADAIQS
ncbi:MAG: hypothetical protein KJ044_16510, partial [Planctomycetes bacterium]|nr:hypothetical protein [Planctomycetota bacterium]